MRTSSDVAAAVDIPHVREEVEVDDVRVHESQKEDAYTKV